MDFLDCLFVRFGHWILDIARDEWTAMDEVDLNI